MILNLPISISFCKICLRSLLGKPGENRRRKARGASVNYHASQLPDDDVCPSMCRHFCPYFILLGGNMETTTYRMQSNIVLICFLMLFLSACGGATNVETAGIPDSGSGVALDESIAVPHSIAVPLMEMDYQSASSLFGT